MRRVKTGYYDHTGKAIRDGDKVRGIMDDNILKGHVEQFDDGTWHVVTKVFSPYLWVLDDIEILEDES